MGPEGTGFLPKGNFLKLGVSNGTEQRSESKRQLPRNRESGAWAAWAPPPCALPRFNLVNPNPSRPAGQIMLMQEPESEGGQADLQVSSQ